MNFYEGYLFFLYLLIALFPAVLLGIFEKPIRCYTLFLSCIFIYLVFHNHPKQFLYLVLFYILEFVIIQTYLHLRQKYERKKNIYYGALILSILPLILSKCTPFWDLNIFGFLGISYL
ncbi:MAG: D-alanyl-lipoteichoic acid biosynthesis protein DltB, partial [Lachnospiraceae bacterium]